MNEKTLIVYSTRTGINSDAAHIIAEVLEKDYSIDVTIADLRDGQPDITPYRNIIVGGGVDDTRVYDAAVDFMDKNFEGKNVALYFSCEDGKNPKVESTEENTRKVLAKNNSLKPIDVAAFGGCRISEGKPAMDELNVERVKDWANKLGKMFSECQQPQPMEEAGKGFFEIHCDVAGKFRFHLKAANGEIIAVSEAYETKQAAENGIESVKKNAPAARIVYKTAE